MTQSRRSFLKTTAAITAASLAAPRLAFSGEAPNSPPLSQFGYGDVELLDGPLRQQFQTNHAFYAALNEDSLLKPFRQRAGIAAPGEEMGGWYSWAPLGDIDKPGDNGFAPGHSFGQYLSGLSRDYAATGSKATQEKVHSIVRNFAPAISPHFWDDNRFPAYTYDKISIGLSTHISSLRRPSRLAILDKALDSVPRICLPGALSRRTVRAPSQRRVVLLGRTVHAARKFLHRLERGAGQRYRDSPFGSWQTTGIAIPSRQGKTCSRTNTPTAT